MARKKKRKSSGRSKGRRVGGIKMGADMEILAGVIGGVVLTRFAKKFIPTTVNEKLVAAVEAAGGGVLAYMSKGGFMKGLGYGIAAGGIQNGLTSFGLITGVGRPIVFSAKPDGGHVAGYRDVPKLGAATGSFPKPGNIGRRRLNPMALYGGNFG